MRRDAPLRPGLPPGPRPGAVALAGFYALYYAAVGVLLPFLPAHLRARGLSASQVGVLLALGPAVGLLAPPLWGHLADRSGRPDRLLPLLSGAAAVALSALLWVEGFPALVVAMGLYGAFYTGIVPLVDSLALRHVAEHGGAYAHLRLFGSLGFVASTVAFGLGSTRLGPETVQVPLALMAAYTLWSLWLQGAPAAPARPPAPLAGLALLRHRDLRLFLAATSLHWAACAPYHGLFGIHVTALGLPPWVVGAAAGTGVAAEVAMMLAFPRFAHAVAPRHLLAASFALSAGRWAGMAVAVSPAALVALSLLHAFTFGAFLLASVGFVARRVPPSLRASGQALFSAATFGLGGLVGYALSGRLFDMLGGTRLFLVAAVAELLATSLVLRVAPARPHPPS